MAAPTIVQMAIAGPATAESYTYTFPSGTTSGNLIVLIAAQGFETDPTYVLPSGFAQKYAVFNNLFQDVSIAIFSGVSAGETTYVLDWTGTAYRNNLLCIELSGADSVEVVGAGQEQSFTTSMVVLGLTTLTNESLHLVMAVHTEATGTHTPPAGYTAVATTPGTGQVSLGVSYDDIPEAVATGNKTITWSAGAASTGWTVGVAIKPSGGGGPVAALPRSTNINQAVRRSSSY